MAILLFLVLVTTRWTAVVSNWRSHAFRLHLSIDQLFQEMPGPVPGHGQLPSLLGDANAFGGVHTAVVQDLLPELALVVKNIPMLSL